MIPGFAKRTTLKAVLAGVDVTKLVESWGTINQVKDMLLATASLMVGEHVLVLHNRKGMFAISSPGIGAGTRWYGKTLQIYRNTRLVYQGVIVDIPPNRHTALASVRSQDVLRIAGNGGFASAATAVNPGEAIAAICAAVYTPDQYNRAAILAAGGAARAAGATVTYAFTASDNETALGAIQQIAALASISVYIANGVVTAKAFRSYQGHGAGLRFPLSDLNVREWGDNEHDAEYFNNRVSVQYQGASGAAFVQLDDQASQSVNAIPGSKLPRAITIGGGKVQAADSASATYFGRQYLARAAYRRALLPVTGGPELAGIQLGDRHPVWTAEDGQAGKGYEVIELNWDLDRDQVQVKLAELVLQPGVTELVSSPPQPTYFSVVMGQKPIWYIRMEETPGATVLVDWSGGGHHGVYA